MAAKSLPPIEILRERFRYCKDSGQLIWRKGRNKGKPAGWVNRKREDLYVRICLSVNGKVYLYLAHRIIWALVHGHLDPEVHIDHLNGDGTDNRLENLRIATPSENQRNKRKTKSNTTGVVGVTYRKNGKPWEASITLTKDGKRRTKYLGTFDTIEEAAAARKEAERKHGFTERHGT
jgi:hypothetical protein